MSHTNTKDEVIKLFAEQFSMLAEEFRNNTITSEEVNVRYKKIQEEKNNSLKMIYKIPDSIKE